MSDETTVSVETDIDVDDITETRETIQAEINAAKDDITAKNTTGYITHIDADGQGGLILTVDSEWGEKQFRLDVTDEDRTSGVTEKAEQVAGALDGDIRRPDTLIGSEVVVANDNTEGSFSLIVPSRGNHWLLSRDWVNVTDDRMYYADWVAGLIAAFGLVGGGAVGFAATASGLGTVAGALLGSLLLFVCATSLIFRLLKRAPKIATQY